MKAYTTPHDLIIGSNLGFGLDPYRNQDFLASYYIPYLSE